MDHSCQSVEQKSFLAGSIARALAVFCVDEVVVFDDDEKSYYNNSRNDNSNNDDDAYESPIAKTNNQLRGSDSQSTGFTAYSDPSHYLAHVLSYLETPPYLRKHLFPMHPNLRTAGLLPSLDMPHHLRANEWCDYREGIVVSGVDQSEGNGSKSNRNRQSSNANGESVVDTGLPQKVVLPDTYLPQNSRATVRFSSQDDQTSAEAVDSSAPRTIAGYYWGYYVRRCQSLSTVFTECPFDGGYDLSFGTSERGLPISHVLEQSTPKNDRGDDATPPLPDHKHLLIIFGGVAGLETAARNDPQLQDMGIRPAEVEKLFDHWVNLLPGQGSRTIRTEEAIWLGLSGLRGLAEGSYRPKRST